LNHNAYIANVVKYLFRYEKKGEPINDLIKACEYLRREIQTDRGLFRKILRFLAFFAISKKLKFETVEKIFGLNAFQSLVFKLVLEQKYNTALSIIESEIVYLEQNKGV
jgi:hypothetical protein